MRRAVWLFAAAMAVLALFGAISLAQQSAAPGDESAAATAQAQTGGMDQAGPTMGPDDGGMGAGGDMMGGGRGMGGGGRGMMGGGMRRGGMGGGMGMGGMMPEMMGRGAIAANDRWVFVLSGDQLLQYDMNLHLVRQVTVPSPRARGGGFGGRRGRGFDGGGMGMGGMGSAPRVQHYRSTTVQMSGQALGRSISGTGTAVLQLGAQGEGLLYRVNVTDLRDPSEAHLHLVRPGQAVMRAPVVAVLFSGPTKRGLFRGTLAEGTLRSRNLIGPLRGRRIADLVSAIDNGEVYVMVHTRQYPNGAIAGQVPPFSASTR